MKDDVKIRLKCLELAYQYHSQEPHSIFENHLKYAYDFVTQQSKRSTIQSKVSNMKDMFKTWAYWKPIVLILGVIAIFTLYLIFATPEIVLGTAVLLAIGVVGFGLHMLGKMCYDDYMYQIKQNYKKLTGKDYDED